jgi:hypothetical protein
MIGRSIWEIDMGDRYGRSDINEISIGMPIWDMGYRFGTWVIVMVIYHIDTVISHIDMGYLDTLGLTDKHAGQPHHAMPFD